VPVLIDRAPAAGGDAILSESAAFLVYLAEKAERLLPIEARLPGKVFEQLSFHASASAPPSSKPPSIQKETSALAKEAALKEVDRVINVLDG
jgi:GST-like protein